MRPGVPSGGGGVRANSASPTTVVSATVFTSLVDLAVADLLDASDAA
jgi:hypothetical protein